MADDLARNYSRMSGQATEVKKHMEGLADKTNTQRIDTILTRTRPKLDKAIVDWKKTASDKPASGTGGDNEIRDAKTKVTVIVDEIVSEIDAINRAVKRVTDSTRILSTTMNQLKLDVDPSDDAKKQTDEDRKAMLVEARNALRKGIMTEKFADLKAGVTPQDLDRKSVV